MLYEILNYRKYKSRIEKILANNKSNPNILVKQPDLATTRFGFPVEHFTIGYGENHLILMAGTHGNEIIGIDFLTQLMANIASGKGEFSDFDPGTYTIHFIPLQNPEGFIISTSTIYAAIPDYGSFALKNYIIQKDKVSAYLSLDTEELEEFYALQQLQTYCKNYYESYKKDDILSSKGDTSLKYHHQLFKDVTPSVIKDPKLQSNVTRLYTTTTFPDGSLIDWRANGSGIDLNANTPYHLKGLSIQRNNEVIYGSKRFNNIRNYVPGPLGAVTLDAKHFGYEPENIGLFNLLDELYSTGKYCGMLTFHSTAGWLYHRPNPDSLLLDTNSNIPVSDIAKINAILANIYAQCSGYIAKDITDTTGVGDLLRYNYPAVLLIELSKMGGNPLGPYGDIASNYYPTIKQNMQAVKAFMTYALRLKPKMYKTKNPELTFQ